MSTFTDGAPPLVNPDPGDDDNPGTEHGLGSDPADDEPGEWLHEEIRRRMAAMAAAGGGARHARRGASAPSPAGVQHATHEPRHAIPPRVPPPRPATSQPAGPTSDTAPIAQNPPRGNPAADPPDAAIRGRPVLSPGVAFREGAAAARAIASTSEHDGTTVEPLRVIRRRPVPPAGPAAARLLSPPPSRPSTPTGIPIAPDPAATDAGARTTDPDPATPVAAPRRYLDYADYEDYDDEYDDPELDAEIADAARREAAAGSDNAVKRVRVVLAERRSIAHPVRTVVDVRDGTGVGEVLRRGLIRSQLKVALSFAAGTMLVLGALPLLFAYLPELGRTSVLGIRLPWLLLGGLVYPFLLGLGWWHARTAEKVEKGFADHVQD
ncbi:MAG: hypothetical protein L0H84_04465 [Pseudonocardia sp.]|nr:hypothetical protein [Pseudonocardia sp.]